MVKLEPNRSRTIVFLQGSPGICNKLKYGERVIQGLYIHIWRYTGLYQDTQEIRDAKKVKILFGGPFKRIGRVGCRMGPRFLEPLILWLPNLSYGSGAILSSSCPKNVFGAGLWRQRKAAATGFQEAVSTLWPHFLDNVHSKPGINPSPQTLNLKNIRRV